MGSTFFPFKEIGGLKSDKLGLSPGPVKSFFFRLHDLFLDDSVTVRLPFGYRFFSLLVTMKPAWLLTQKARLPLLHFYPT